jgi:WD40 repeat protein
VFDPNHLQPVLTLPNAHPSAIYTLKYIDENLVVSGDDDGEINIWDLRTAQSAYQVHEQREGTVTDFVWDQARNFLLSTSTYGTLAVYDLRKPAQAKDKLYAMSDEMDEEMNCIALISVG